MDCKQGVPNPSRFSRTICDKAFSCCQKMKLHMETVHAAGKPCFRCSYCHATFSRHDDRQTYMRRKHERRCREKDLNLYLHFQHLSEEDDFKNEWVFVESRPIQRGVHNVCPCGQTPLHSFFFMENNINGNRTFVGSDCIRNVDPKAAAVICHFKYNLEKAVQGTYKGQDDTGVQTLQSTQHYASKVLTCSRTFKPASNKKHRGSLASLGYLPSSRDQKYTLRLKATYKQGQHCSYNRSINHTLFYISTDCVFIHWLFLIYYRVGYILTASQRVLAGVEPQWVS